MLAAAASLSMLDIHSAIISALCTKAGDASGSLTLDQDALLWDSTDSSPTTSTISSSNQGVTSIQAFAELSRVVKVVLQFAVKYGGGDLEQSSPDFLRALACFLRSRLQCITAEATSRVEK